MMDLLNISLHCWKFFLSLLLQSPTICNLRFQNVFNYQIVFAAPTQCKLTVHITSLYFVCTTIFICIAQQERDCKFKEIIISYLDLHYCYPNKSLPSNIKYMLIDKFMQQTFMSPNGVFFFRNHVPRYPAIIKMK